MKPYEQVKVTLAAATLTSREWQLTEHLVGNECALVDLHSYIILWIDRAELARVLFEGGE